MASFGDIAGVLGNAIEGFQSSRVQDALLRRKLQEEGEEKNLSLAERRQMMEMRRIQMEQLLQKDNPDLLIQHKYNTAIKAGWSPEDARAISFGLTPAKKEKKELTLDEMIMQSHKEASKFGSPGSVQYKQAFNGSMESLGGKGLYSIPKTEETSATRTIEQEIALLEKKLGRKLTPEELLSKFGVTGKTGDSKQKDTIKRQIAPKLQKLRSAELALDAVERINKDNADIIGPAVGRALQASPWKTQRFGKVSTTMKQTVTRAVEATGAGARGYGPMERGWFERMSEAMNHTPEENQGIIDAWREFVKRERQSYLEQAQLFDIDPSFFGDALGSGVSGSFETKKSVFFPSK